MLEAPARPENILHLALARKYTIIYLFISLYGKGQALKFPNCMYCSEQ
jgi:hypothetical protein